MKHCILVKWNALVKNKNEIAKEVKSLFLELLTVKGVRDVKIHQNVIDRANRYDLMILIEMDKEVLPIYDDSKPHHEWKEKYGKFVENKAIFDFEA